MLRYTGYFLSCLVSETMHLVELRPQMGGLSILRMDIQTKFKHWWYQDVEVKTDTVEEKVNSETLCKPQVPRGLRWSETWSSASGI